MAINKTPMKISALAKDFNLKSKDVIDIFAALGVEKKTSGTVDSDEFSAFLEHITTTNQISNMSDYLAGKADISRNTENTEKKEAPAKVAPAKSEARKEAKAKSETVKEAVKTEAAPAPVKKEAPKAEPAKVEAPEAEAQKIETPKVEAPKAETPKKEAIKEDVAPKAITEETKKEETAPVSEQKPTPKETADTSAVAKPVISESKTQEKAQTYAPKTQSMPMNKKIENTERNTERNMDRRPQQSSQRPSGDNPRYGQNNQNRPANDRKFGDRNNAPAQSRPQQNQTQAPQAHRPAETPIPVPQPQKPKEKKEQQPMAPKTTRIVDTRTTDVDLSKYDERLENFVPESARRSNVAPDRQKLKKKQNDNPFAKGTKDKNKTPDKLKKQEVKKPTLNVSIPDEIVVSDLAAKLKVTASEVIKRLFMMGVMASVNQVIDYETAYLVADELGANVTKEVVVTIEEKLFDEVDDNPDTLETRPPVVCVMGHVDHGKTSLLDAIRHTHVTSGEAGGITQHIGAYRVNCNGEYITFLDTPGHEAFTAMRARGAKSTDIAILVVAADDGIMPQTVEAINHAKAADIPIIVAINKIDKPTANPDAIKTELTKYDLVPEEWGGDTICVPVSALKGTGISELLEMVLLVAEVKEFKANPNRRAKGIVIEAKLDRGRGPVATVLVQNGTLHAGDTIIVGTAVGRVRAMTDDKGKVIKTAGPSVPVEIIGLDSVPSAGDELNAVEDERMAKELAEQRRQKEKEEVFKANAKVNLDDLFAQMTDGVKDLNIIVKADVKGSAEAVKASLEKLTNEEVKVNVIHTGVGGIIEGDVTFAAASNAIIVGFNVRPDKMAMDSAELQGVDIRTYRIIYECIEEITAAIKGMLKPVYKEVVLGHAEVRQTIHVPNVGTIAGSYITDGKVTRASQIRVVRDGVIIFEDKISSLRRFKDDVKEVASGYECGIGLDKFNDIKEHDVLEAYIMEQIER